MTTTANTISVKLTPRQWELLDILCSINVDVPKAVVNVSQMHYEERDNGALREHQKREMLHMLQNLQDQIHATRPRAVDSYNSACVIDPDQDRS